MGTSGSCKNPENGFHEREALTPSTNHSKKIIISLSTLQSIKSEAITMLKVVILAMCFEGDITFVLSELKAWC